jgi:hypothetical protein
LDVVLDPKIVVRSSGVMTRRQQYTTIGLVLADDVRARRRGEDAVLADEEVLDAVSGTDLEDGLDGLGHEEPAITSDEEGFGDGGDGVEDGLDEVLGVVLFVDAFISVDP